MSQKILSPEFYESLKRLEPRYPTKVALLLPALHAAQEERGWLSPEVLAEVADYIGIHPAQAREVASFYNMYHLKPVGRHVIRLCTNVSCCLRGADQLFDHLKRKLGVAKGETTKDGRFTLIEEECLGACGTAPAMMLDDDYHESLTREKLDRILEGCSRPSRNDATDVATPPVSETRGTGGVMAETLYIQHFKESSRPLSYYLKEMHGYQAARKALAMAPDAVIEEVKKSNLRGRGGAGFPTGMKWGFIPKKSEKPKYVVCNADESEPGTFKDRDLIRYTPHLLIEGMIIAGHAIGSQTGYIYIRGEYTREAKILQAAVDEAYEAGHLGKGFDITVHRGAGAYICGEETALLNSLEGKRGEPRVKPPFPAIAGAFGGPTIVNNVETLCAVPHILRNGGEWFAKLGKWEKSGGTRLFCVSGHVKKPGLYELPAGSVTLRQLIYEHAGGILDDRPLKAVIPGGSSAPVLTAEEIDVVCDIEPMMKAGTMLGSAAIIVISDAYPVTKLIRRITHFYAVESCGQCTPCREGCRWMEDIFNRILKGQGRPQDLPLLLDVADNINGKTLCALGDAAAGPVMSFVKKFRSDFEALMPGGERLNA